ncbi:MAG: hypothetical protein Q8Q91_01605 [Candidatus Daviesbacteria bacterium]|nr:hypothetical protein [Candidatus Daviesbacteria bacterium]
MRAEFVYPGIHHDPQTGIFCTDVIFAMDSYPAAAVPNILKILREHPKGLRERVDGLTILVTGDKVRISSHDQGAVDMAGRAFSYHPHALSLQEAVCGWTRGQVMTFQA